jgi:hypothetical protein
MRRSSLIKGKRMIAICSHTELRVVQGLTIDIKSIAHIGGLRTYAPEWAMIATLVILDLSCQKDDVVVPTFAPGELETIWRLGGRKGVIDAVKARVEADDVVRRWEAGVR